MGTSSEDIAAPMLLLLLLLLFRRMISESECLPCVYVHVQREVLEQARSMLITGWDGVVSSRIKGESSSSLLKSSISAQSGREKEAMEQFLQLLQHRIVRTRPCRCLISLPHHITNIQQQQQSATENKIFYENLLYDYVVSAGNEVRPCSA